MASPQTLRFLDGIAEHNDADWFAAHRTDYDAYWVAPARAFVGAAGTALRRFVPGIQAEPKINGSIFRITRDRRFAPDRPPYKPYLDLWFWEGERRTAVSGFYLRLTPTTLGVGVGAHRFDREHLAAFRRAVVDPAVGPGLARAVTTLERKGYPLHGERFRRLPRGCEPTTARQAQLLRHDALWVGRDEEVTEVVHTPAVLDHVVAEWRAMAPLHRRLVAALQ